MSEKKLALIDGYGFVFRAFHSLPPLTRSDKTPVGAVYGFTNMLIKLLASLHVSHVAVVFDSGSKTFRNDIYPQYKAHRPPCPEELIPQFPLVREAAESLNLKIIEKVGFEADDIIATLAKEYAKNDFEVLIISSDKDLMQLVGDNIKMYDAMKNKFIAENEVKEKFAVAPNKVLDVLSLMGDASDNIPGVKGIGPKTAAELIQQFGNLENIFLNLDQIKQEKRREILKQGEENAKLSKILLTLREDVDLNLTASDLALRAVDPDKLIAFVQKQGFRSLLERIKKEFGVNESENSQAAPDKPETHKNNFDEITKIEISDAEIFTKIRKQAQENGFACIDFADSAITISTYKSDETAKEIYYFEINCDNKNEEIFDLFKKDQPQTLDLKGFEQILQDETIKKIFYDAKNFLRKYKFIDSSKINLTLKSFEDVAVMNHLLHSSPKNDLAEIINLNLNEDLEARGFNKIFSDLEKEKLIEEFVDKNKKITFYSFRNFAISELYKILSPRIVAEKLSTSYQIYEKPLLPILAQMEVAGIEIDTQKLQKLSQEFATKIAQLSQEIYALAGQEFNIASPKQIGEILFEKMQLESNKKSKKTGALSTGVAVLEELAEQGFEIAQKILDFRKFSKLKNTYTDALPKEINAQTKRVHSHFSSINTITGRLSSSNPNLQNIPIKSEEGRKIRQAFVAKKNHFLVSADYSQIELRVIAHIAKIETLINAFKEGKDIHRITAAQIFHLQEENVSDEIRSKAKAINFGIIYGISGFGLARQLGISRKEAADYIKSYLETYPGIDVYMKKYIDLARSNGYVETLGGRKCFIRAINDKNPIIRAEAERLAINAPIQGSAADIVKKAMIRLDKKISEMKLQSKLILQIHDELIIESPEDEVEKVALLLKSEMENAMSLDVSLKVDVQIAKFWQ